MNVRHTVSLDNTSRIRALVVLAGLVIGNTLMETGNIAAHYMELSDHYFNPFWGTLGLIGLLWLGYSLARRRHRVADNRMVKKEDSK